MDSPSRLCYIPRRAEPLRSLIENSKQAVGDSLPVVLRAGMNKTLRVLPAPTNDPRLVYSCIPTENGAKPQGFALVTRISVLRAKRNALHYNMLHRRPKKRPVQNSAVLEVYEVLPNSRAR